MFNKIFGALLVFALLITACNLHSQDNSFQLSVALSGGVYGELEPCG